jgi:hypothetical protein
MFLVFTRKKAGKRALPVHRLTPAAIPQRPGRTARISGCSPVPDSGQVMNRLTAIPSSPSLVEFQDCRTEAPGARFLHGKNMTCEATERSNSRSGFHKAPSRPQDLFLPRRAFRSSGGIYQCRWRAARRPGRRAGPPPADGKLKGLVQGTPTPLPRDSGWRPPIVVYRRLDHVLEFILVLRHHEGHVGRC